MTPLAWIRFANSVAIPVGVLLGLGVPMLLDWVRERRAKKREDHDAR